MDGRVPEFAIVMHVERVLIHCPKCVLRAKLWQPEQWPDSSNTAGIAAAMIAHAKLDTSGRIACTSGARGPHPAVLGPDGSRGGCANLRGLHQRNSAGLNAWPLPHCFCTRIVQE